MSTPDDAGVLRDRIGDRVGETKSLSPAFASLLPTVLSRAADPALEPPRVERHAWDASDQCRARRVIRLLI